MTITDRLIAAVHGFERRCDRAATYVCHLLRSIWSLCAFFALLVLGAGMSDDDVWGPRE